MFDVPRNSLYAMLAVFGLLVVATFTRLVLAARHRERDYTELRQRIQSWWVMVAILCVVLTISSWAAIVFFALLSLLALREFLAVVPLREADRRPVLWAFLAVPVQYYWIYIGWYGMFIIFVPVYLFLLLPLRLVLRGETQGFIRSASVLQWAVMLTVYCLSHVAYLLQLPPLNEQAGSVGLVLFLLITTQLNDVSQYVWGKLLGRHKIVPRVSPNKTWEGFLGGLATTTLCASGLAPLLTPLSVPLGLAVGAIIAAAGFVGDVVLSAVKRDLAIKDAGHLIPGHGGLLDRMDSLFYTAPLFFHFVYYYCY